MKAEAARAAVGAGQPTDDCAERDAMSMFAAIQAMALSLRVEVIPINMLDASEIKQHVETFARKVA